jgi:nucleotide-binding universal stress UspA family protein
VAGRSFGINIALQIKQRSSNNPILEPAVENQINEVKNRAKKTELKTKQSGDGDQEKKPIPIKKMSATGPMIWAIDPIEKDLNQLKLLHKALRTLRLSSDIIPVSVVGLPDVKFPLRLGPLNDAVSGSINSSLQTVLKKVLGDQKGTKKGMKTALKKLVPNILIQKTRSRRQLAIGLLELAHEKNSPLIAVNTHGKKGLARLGSFAEILIALSQVPVLTVNPKTKVSEKISTVLFATEFSEASSHALDMLLVWAKMWKAKVVLFHKLTLPPIPMLAEGAYLNETMVEDYFQSWKTEIKEKATRWQQKAIDQGVQCELSLIEKAGSVDSLVTKESIRQKADLIALATYEGPIAQAILGSTASDVLLNAQRPVIVIHTK